MSERSIACPVDDFSNVALLWQYLFVDGVVSSVVSGKHDVIMLSSDDVDFEELLPSDRRPPVGCGADDVTVEHVFVSGVFTGISK